MRDAAALHIAKLACAVRSQHRVADASVNVAQVRNASKGEGTYGWAAAVFEWISKSSDFQISREDKFRKGSKLMRQRIRVALAVAAVAAIAAIVSYLWRVFRIGQTSKKDDAGTEDSEKTTEKHRESKQ
jgi:hypothetical protein